jgi:UDP-N-acetylmuramyl pentapeptide phosphotransferase/UDP-N-acetylglucosamine-1-phosphate transferase
MSALIVFAVTLPASWLAVKLVLGWLRHKQILDHPNERSSHSLPTPRGGGLAVTPLVLLAWCFAPPLAGQWAVMAGAVGLLALSWMDDRASLPAGARLLLQALAVALGLAFLPPVTDLPFWADRLLCGLAWLWFVNLFNFMDGIDGISGVETIAIAAGMVLLGFALPQSAALIAAMSGFLMWNWHPAKIFLGDSGSVPLGYLLGFLLLSLGGQGHPAAALILPAYYLADATITLGKRALRGEKVWQAHRQHFYQQAVQGGASHAQVSLLIAAANVGLVGCALWPNYGIAAAALLTAALLLWLRRLGRGQRP